MNINATSAGNTSANSSIHGSSNSSRTYPQLNKDATQIVYSWLPHSTALGASSTVAVRVRNASLTGVGVRNNNTFMPPSLEDEKKYNEGGDFTMNHANRLECRVDASIYGHGLPLQASAISTKYSSLIPYNDESNNNLYSNHPDFACGKEWSTATFDTLVSLPVRWRDLTRDACLTLNVYCDGECTADNNADGHNKISLTGNTNQNTNGDDQYNSATQSRVWGTTLPLFDENGRLRSGLYKLNLHPDTLADGGMSYQSKGDGQSIETFLEGGATPGISHNANNRHSRSHYGGWFDGRKLDAAGEEDPKWKASLILHELNRLETPSPPSVSSTPGSGMPSAVTQQQANSRPVSWLDALTQERCIDILNEQDEDEGYYNGTPTAANTQQHGILPAPTSLHHNTPYLIIELPTPPIPILHEEPIYPVETSTHLRGTTGSITANELIKFHSKFRTEEECDTDGLAIRISPKAMDMLPSEQPQAFLYPLVQILDHEPPLADENENPQDNPAQDKYRILAHDLIRGLVDPGLKPDRVQRGRLERIVGSPSYHLSTEEKDLLWRFRFSLVDNRRALTKFLLAVDWTVESEVVQAAELLEQWKKRSPIEVTDALKLLGRNVAFQTSLVRLPHQHCNNCVFATVFCLLITMFYLCYFSRCDHMQSRRSLTPQMKNCGYTCSSLCKH